MSNNTEPLTVSGINEYVADESLIYQHSGNDEESKQYYMGVDIYFEDVFTTTSK